MDEHLLTDCARNMWAFPLVGAFLGLLAGLFGWVAIHFLPGIVVGALVLALLLWMTGLHHTDGLLDFGDGVMAHGTPEHKIDVMHDQLTGAGALALGIMTMLIAALSFGQLGLGNIVRAVIVVELCAKLSMVVVARVGRPVRQGMNSAFLVNMQGIRRQPPIDYSACDFIYYRIGAPQVRRHYRSPRFCPHCLSNGCGGAQTL